MKFYLRLVLYMPLLRLTMLLEELDESIEPTYVEPDYTELDELVKLHARAMLHMNNLGWPLGKVYRVQTGARVFRTGMRRKAVSEPVHEELFGIKAHGEYILMRSGAIYGPGHSFEETLKYEGRPTPYMRPLDMARMDAAVRSDMEEIFQDLLAREPQPVYIT